METIEISWGASVENGLNWRSIDGWAKDFDFVAKGKVIWISTI
jgi:hypothetical protein